MSFPRAKIQRFNDILNNVPSPTKYDPKVGDKVKGGCILKSETKHSTLSDTASASSGKSCQTPVFRTPQVPKRHNCLGVLERGTQSAFKSISFKSDDMEVLHNEGESEELKSLRVECSNKTETINDLEKHVQDLKTQLSDQEKAKAKLESYIVELKTAKSNLECIKSNNENYEQQISTLQMQIREMEMKINELVKNKVEISSKIDEMEKKNNKLEESNLDYERKFINLEGTIEQLQMERASNEESLAELKQKEEMLKMNHKVAIECLQGKISTLENEIKVMDANKSKNEETIFGLETQISNLNCMIENLKTDKNEMEILTKELKSRLEELESVSKSQATTVESLQNELDEKVTEVEQLKNAKNICENQIHEIKLEIEKQAAEFEKRQNDLIETHKKKVQEIEKKYEAQTTVLNDERKDFENQKNCLVRSYEEEILRLQNEYESKLLAQMQENTEKISILHGQLDDKDASIKRANNKHAKALAEWEEKLQEAENNFSDLVNKLEAQHLENIEVMKDSHASKMKTAESNFTRVIDMKNKEIDLLAEQYKEILEEMKCLLGYLEKKDEEIKDLNVTNKTMSSRMKMMLEEIKLLNKENENKSESLNKITKKYNDEFSKNEQLSCKLGELDTKLYHLKEDLNKKVEDWKKSSDDLKKSKMLYDRLLVKKSDLEQVIGELQSKVEKLSGELKETTENYEGNMLKLREELTAVTSKCKKFEIASGNTSKALEALRERLMECEADVEKLQRENSCLVEKLEKVKQEKGDVQMQLEKMIESKFDLEATLDEQVATANELSERCNKLESSCKDYEEKHQELTMLNEVLIREKQTHIETMKNLVREHELQLIEAERYTLDQVEQINQTVTEKIDFFMKFSSEKVKKLSTEITNLKASKEKINQSLVSKTEDYDNLYTDYEILKTTVDISVKESENLKNKCQEQVALMEEMKKSLEGLVKEKEGVEKKLLETEREYAEVLEQRKNLQKELDAKIENLEKMEETNSNMKDEIETLKSEAEKLGKKFNVQLKDLELKVAELERNLREKNRDFATCQEEKMLCMEEIKVLSMEKNDLAFNLKMADGKLSANEKLVQEFREAKEEAEIRNKKLKIELDSVIAEKSSMESELLSVKEEVSSLRREIAALDPVVERKNYYKDNCLRLDKLNQELKEENTSLKNDFNEIHCLLKEKERDVEKLSKKCSELETLIGPFREQLERYETERALIENDREQLRKMHLEQAAELGHRNHKQKIQHVVNLKNTLLETRKENEKLTLVIKTLKKKIQKLQEEVGHDPKRLFIGGKRPSSTPFKGKENNSLMTPSAAMVVSSTTQVKQEPMSPGSPLRNRNQ